LTAVSAEYVPSFKRYIVRDRVLVLGGIALSSQHCLGEAI
jgi:hypothetical protein